MNSHLISEFSNKKIFFTSQSRLEEMELFISDSVEMVTGFSPKEISTFPELYHSLIIPADIPKFKEELANFEKDRKRNSLELVYRIHNRAQEIKWINEFVDVSRDTNSGIILIKKSVCLDISDIKQNETELENSRELLKEINSSKDKFISIISHDLRAPFTTLLGFSEILINEQDISEEEKREYIEYIYESSKNQLNLINCLLDWSRLQTGRVKVEPVRLNVRTIISNALAPLTGDAVRKNIDIKIDIPTDFYFNADERLIGQAIINLTSNAIKYSPEGKNVTISAGRFKAGMIEIVIRDEGLGISEENQSKLFKIDQKFSLAGTNGEKGSGLGLTLVKEIIDKHGGQVWFYSTLGEGSEFHFTVEEAKNLIMIIENDPNTRTHYQQIIAAALPSFDVKFAKNGYEAIGFYKEFLPTLIMIDHDMPLMNGIQFIDAIHKKEANKSVPIIVATSKMDELLIQKYAKLGIEKLLPKPVNSETLINMIQESLK